MRAVVLVDHGSRSAEANAQLERVAERVRERLPDRSVAIAHMELAPPDLASAIDACAKEGATEIVVAPWFLAPGRHATEDLARTVEEARARHPDVSLVLADPLGVHAGLVDAVVDRINAGGSPTRRG